MLQLLVNECFFRTLNVASVDCESILSHRIGNKNLIDIEDREQQQVSNYPRDDGQQTKLMPEYWHNGNKLLFINTT